MAAAIGVRGDYNAARLRELAKRSVDANQTRRLLALAAIYDGGARTAAAKIGGGRARKVGGVGLGFYTEGPPGVGYWKWRGTPPPAPPTHPEALPEALCRAPCPT